MGISPINKTRKIFTKFYPLYSINNSKNNLTFKNDTKLEFKLDSISNIHKKDTLKSDRLKEKIERKIFENKTKSYLKNKIEKKNEELGMSQDLNKQNNFNYLSKKNQSFEFKTQNVNSNNLSLKSTIQLRRIIEDQKYSSFIEKESFSLNESIENSRMVFLPNMYDLNLAEIHKMYNATFENTENDNSSIGKTTNRMARFFVALLTHRALQIIHEFFMKIQNFKKFYYKEIL